MKKIIAILLCYLFSCTQNNKPSGGSSTQADTAKVPGATNEALKKDIKAGAVLPSDSLDPGTTTAEQWRISGFDKPDEFKTFFKKFKEWVASDNIDSITAHIRFPLRNCKSADVFKKNYSTYFNDLVKTSVAGQNPDKFFANYNGAMTGNGELWFNEIKGKYYVIAINNKP